MSEMQSESVSANVESPLNQATAPAQEPSHEASGPQIPEKFGGDINKLVESYNHLESKMGTMYSLPSQDSSPEKWQEFDQRVSATGRYIKMPDSQNPDEMNAFYNSLGRPESPEKYDFKLPEEVQAYVDRGAIEQYKQLAYSVGLNSDVAQKLVDFEVQRGLNELRNIEENKVMAEQKLRQVWGQDYENRLAGAKAAANTYAEKYPEELNRLINGPEGNNPVVVAMMSELGRHLQEQGHIGSGNAPQYGMSRAEALDKINEIQNNMSHAYHNELDPAHINAKKEVNRLYSIAYPDG